MAAANPFDALDEPSSAAPATPAAASGNPFDALDEAPVQEQTSSAMQQVTDRAQLPQVTVSAKRPLRESTWSEVAAGIPTAIGAGIESKIGGTEEYIGSGAYEDAKKKLWQSLVLPEAVRDAQKRNMALTDLPIVQDTAKHVGVRPDVFTRDWPDHVNMTDPERDAYQRDQRDRMQTGAQQAASGSKRRLTAAQVQEAYAPSMDQHSLKSVVFDSATMAPDILAGVGAAVATGGVGGAAVMAADIAPNEYAAARNRGLDHKQASTYAILSTVASSVPEVPVLKVVENTPFARKVIGSVVGEKLAKTGVGKVAGTAAAQGVTQAVVNALQQGVDAGVLNEHLPLDEALKQVAWSGLVGSVVGAPMGVYHAATTRAPRGGRNNSAGINPVPAGEKPPEALPEETGPGSAAVEAPAAAGGPSGETVAGPSPEVNRQGTANPEAVAPNDVQAALQAVKDKTVTPPQADLLEAQGLVKRNDLNEPVLLPKGRRRLAELNSTVSDTNGAVTSGNKEAETSPIEAKKGSEVAIPPSETPPEPVKPAKVSRKPAQPVEKPPVQGEIEPSALGNRLSTDQDLRAGLTAMKDETGWAQVGGRVIRDATTDQVSGRTTWIPNSEWWPGRPKGLKEAEVHAAIDKALTGQPLKRREQAMVDYMAQVHDERTAMAATHEELKQAVPELAQQPEGSLDLTLLTSRAGEHDAEATGRVMDSWNDDKPETIARVRGELEQIIGRGHQQKESLVLTAQEGGREQPSQAARSPTALDLFGEDRSKEQALADEQRRRDALRSPNRDVSVETGLPGDLFSQARKQVDLVDASEGMTTEQIAANTKHERVEQSEGVKKGDIVRITDKEHPDHGKLAHVRSIYRYRPEDPFRFRVWHQEHYGEVLDRTQITPTGQADFLEHLEAARGNTHPEPTEAQKQAGNYKKGRVAFGGMEVAIENPKGSKRSGVGHDGKQWSREMAHDYGYIAGTNGKDGDAVDVFLTGKPDTGKVYVVNQVRPDTGEFDEHKAVLGASSEGEARSVYEANYPKGWEGEESIAELTTPDFKRWVESKGPARGPIRPPSKLERRSAAARRAKVAEMSPEELRKEILTHELTSIPNRRAYEESQKLPHQVSIDVDSLKWVNDNMGHESGNELLKAIAGSLSAHSDNVFHLSGDEFAAQAHTETEAHELMRNVSEHLKNATIEVEMPDGRVVKLKGLGVSYGVGKNLEQADAALSAHKARRQAEGHRAGRGEAPPGATIRAREEGRQDQTGSAAEGVEPKFARSNPQTETPEFKHWFGGSKVTDEHGQPLVVYHGTGRPGFSRFDPLERGSSTGAIDSKLGFFFAENPHSADQFTWHEGNKVGAIYPVYLSLKNPLVVPESRMTLHGGSTVQSALSIQKAKAGGHDGVIFESSDMLGHTGRSFVAFDPRQIKSAVGNRGTFDAAEHDIRKRVTNAQGGLPRAHVERIVHQAVREPHLGVGFPHVEVHDDSTSLPQHIQSVIKQQGAELTTGAVYDPASGRIHLIASNNGSEREVRENLWHEAVGHHGLRMAMDRPQYNAIMDGIARDMPERVEAAARRNGLNLNDLEQKRAAAEEVIAYAAGQHLSGQPIDKPVVPFWTRAVRAVKSFFAKMTGRPFYDDKAIAGLIQQAQQALERGTAGSTPGEPRRSTRAPIYYSPVERAVSSSKQAKASADQWLATIKKQPGIKPEELEWLNLEPWLKSHTGPITKQEFEEYIRANKLEIRETVHGGMGGEQTDDERKQIQLAEELRAEGHEVHFDDYGNLERIGIPQYSTAEPGDYHHGDIIGRAEYHMHDPGDVAALPDSIRQRAQILDDISVRVAAERVRRLEAPQGWSRVEGATTRYGEYTLPGGQNYRELLLRLPEKEFDPTAHLEWAQGLHGRWAWFDGDKQVSGSFENESDKEAAKSTLNSTARQDSGNYHSGHWSEPNIVAHTRFNERTDADGKKVLFIEEVQSDWHQQGRTRGYVDEAKRAELRRRNTEALRRLGVADQAKHAMRRADFSGTAEEAERINNEARDALVQQQSIERELIASHEAPPPAPFKTSWPMLVMKRMVRWAAEHGIERIAWTTGKQQAERYNLGNHVDAIHYSKDEDGKYWLYMEQRGHEVARDLQRQGMDEQQLREFVGAEVAQKIINGEGRYTSVDPAVKYPERVLEGLDLQTGGEGMKGFYDQILPRETDKLIKKYGGQVTDGRVKGAEQEYGPLTIEQSATGQYFLHSLTHGAVSRWYATAGEAQAALQKYDGHDSHGFDITPEMRNAALGEGFPMFARRQQQLPLQQTPKPGAYEAVRRAVDAVLESKPLRDVRKLVSPVGMSAESKQVAQIGRAALGELAHETVKTQEALEQFSRMIDKTPIADQLEMMDAIERGAAQPHQELQGAADEMRKLLDTWRDKVRGLGDGYLDNFIEDYFPHYWREPGEAQRMVASIMGRRPLRGPASFLKMRTIPTIKEGMDAGLTPLTTNPLIMTLLKAREMQRFVTGVTLMRRFKEDGLAQFLPAGKPMPDGWAPINDNIAKVRQWSEAENGFIERGQYVMPLDAARVINNHVSASALRDFSPAQVFRRGANALNALQLGFSAFHLGFTTLDAMISKNAQGIERVLHGDVAGAVRSFGEGLTPVGAYTNVRRGYKLLQAYTNPAGATPEMAKLVHMLELGGGRAHMDRYYQAAEGVSPFRGVGLRSLGNDVRKALTSPQDKVANLGRALGQFPIEYGNKLWKGMQEIWQTTPKLEVPIEMAMRVVRASTSWIMEHLVPMQKLGVFSDLANDHLQRNPREDPNARAAAMQRIWDSVDNRLGEMVYDNVFWNRTLKDTLHLGVRAVGWNLGTIREIGGAPVDIVKAVDKLIQTGKVSADDIGHRIPYVLAMTATTALYASVYQYLATGQGPDELKDYFFPKTGGSTNYGTPARVSLPSYVKDVYEYSQRPGRTVVNKMNPIFAMIGSLYSNEDYFGNPITDPEAGYWQQKLQQLQFVGREARPFSFQGKQQMSQTDKQPGFGAAVRRTLPMIGITPAPGYITSGEQIERRQRLEADQKYTRNLKFQLKRAMEAKDPNAKELAKEYAEAVKRAAQTQKLVDQDRGKAAVQRRKAATSMRQQGFPATANLVAALPLEPDAAAHQYFSQLG